MDKKTIVRNPQIIRIKVDKTPKMRKYFKTPTIKVYDAMITWYRCGQSTFSSSSCDLTEKSKKWTKAPQDESPKGSRGQNPQKWQRKAKNMDKEHHQDESHKGSESRLTKPPKMRKYLKTPTIKVYDPMITWYRCGQSTFSSSLMWPDREKQKITKAPQDESPKGSESRWTKNPKNEKIF